MTHRKGAFENLARWATRWAGSTPATIIAFVVVILWFAFGPFFQFSTDYQMYINTGTTIVTFLMVFLLQRSQNIDAQAIQLKLNELVAAVHGASNRLINIEDLSEEELAALHLHYKKLVELAKHEHDLTRSHSIEEARRRHARKHGKPTAPDGHDHAVPGPDADRPGPRG